MDGLRPWFYLAAPVVFALCVGIGYMAGPKMWARQVRMMEKAKKEISDYRMDKAVISATPAPAKKQEEEESDDLALVVNQ